MKSSRKPDRQLYTKKQVADLLRLSVRHVDRMIERGELVPCSFGYRTIRIPAIQIDQLIEERTLGGVE